MCVFDSMNFCHHYCQSQFFGKLEVYGNKLGAYIVDDLFRIRRRFGLVFRISYGQHANESIWANVKKKEAQSVFDRKPI